MADTVETSARSLGDAIAHALSQLGISEDQATIVVINEGSKGILGIGAEDARVRVSRRSVAAPVAPKPAPIPAPRQAPVPELPVAAPQIPVASVAEATSPASQEPSLTTGEVAQVAKQVVLELLQAMGIAARINMRNVASRADQPLDGENPIVLDIAGDDLGILIGRRGETLSALQLVTNLIVGRRTHQWARIVVDVEGYRLRREETLRNLALRMADRVRYSRTPFIMEAMPPNERRIVHMALKDNPYVATESHGDGEERRVTISPLR